MRLIDGDALIRKFKTASPMAVDGRARQMVEDMPTIEPKTGKWIEVEVFPDSYDIYGNKTWSSEMQCDQCGFRHTAIEGHIAQYNYCPNCGADMRGEQNEL